MDIAEKLSSTFTTERKTKYSYTLVEQHFYDRTQNSIQLHFVKQNKGVTNLKTAHEKGTRNQKIRRAQNYVMTKKKPNHKININSLKEDKIYTLVSKQ